MSDVVTAIRDKIRYHQAQIVKLEKMLEVGGEAIDPGTLRGRILELLTSGPLRASDIVAQVGGKANSVYVKLSRMRKEGALARSGELYSIAREE